jgi:hypothetical protein
MANTEKNAIADIPRANKWSDRVLSVMCDGKSVRDHLVLAVFEARVFDKNTGKTKKELFADAAAVVNEHILARVTFTQRVGSQDQLRRSAPLTWNTLQTTIEQEMSNFKAANDKKEKETGVGAEETWNEAERTLMQLIQLRDDAATSKTSKAASEADDREKMSSFAKKLLTSVAQNSTESKNEDDDSKARASPVKSMSKGFSGALTLDFWRCWLVNVCACLFVCFFVCVYVCVLCVCVCCVLCVL